MRTISNQLSLFGGSNETFISADENLTKKANQLLETLNENLKRDFWEQYSYVQVDDLIVLVARNKKDFLFNIVDLDGKAPPDFPVNWRNPNIVRDEIQKYIADKK